MLHFFKAISVTFVSLAIGASCAPVVRREVPQEHSHEKIITSVRASLNLNNPDQIEDPIFALLGDAAAAAGAGNVKVLSCLQQVVADQAFTNAKAQSDVAGMTNALIFRALERNTGQVGLASELCNQTASNPEIQALTQHQDAASNNAASINKNITLALAQQIAIIGGNPLDALQSGTFAPGNVSDPTAKGNSCNDPNDQQGCIFTLNLLVNDATEEEISIAVAEISSSSSDQNSNGISSVDTALVETSTDVVAVDSGSSESVVIVQVTTVDTISNGISGTATTVLVAIGESAPIALTPILSAADNNGTAVYQAKLPTISRRE